MTTLLRLAALALLALVAGPALAQSAAPAPVVVPWGDWLASNAPTLGGVVLAVALWLVRHLPAQAAGVLMSMRVDQLLARAIDYGVNVTQGAARGKTLEVAVASDVMRAALQYAVAHAPELVERAGGLTLVRQKIAARLDVDEGRLIVPGASPPAPASRVSGHAWLGAILASALMLGGCVANPAMVELGAQGVVMAARMVSPATVERLDRTVAQVAGSETLAASCAIFNGAAGYYDDARARGKIATSYARLGDATSVAGKALCASRPADTAAALVTLNRLWAGVQAATVTR